MEIKVGERKREREMKLSKNTYRETIFFFCLFGGLKQGLAGFEPDAKHNRGGKCVSGLGGWGVSGGGFLRWGLHH